MKPKSVLIVPAKYATEMFMNADVEQKLASGSYLIATRPKKPTANTLAQRAFKRRRGEAGFKKLEALLDQQIYNALQARRQDSETIAGLIERLINLPDNNDQISMVDAQN
jgi:hypothetical protein